jgi:predicted Holliday junction resolvase-like endonuclease
MEILEYIIIIIFLFILIKTILLWLNKEKHINIEYEKKVKRSILNLKTEYENIQKEIINYRFNEWKNDNEFEIRRTAIYDNRSSITDTITDDLSIINKNFSFNPKDIKFVGRFIDLIIFDGSTEEDEINIYFVEIVNKNIVSKNTYKSKVESAILNRRYSFQEISL